MKVSNALASLLSLLLLDAVVALPQANHGWALEARAPAPDAVEAWDAPIVRRAAAPEPVAAPQNNDRKGGKGGAPPAPADQAATPPPTANQPSGTAQPTGAVQQGGAAKQDPAAQQNDAQGKKKEGNQQTDAAQVSGAAQPTGAVNQGNGKGNNVQGNGNNQGGVQQPDAAQNDTADATATASQPGAAQSGAAAADPSGLCKGTLTNGKQVKEGSCNPVIMGQLPASNKMLSQLITFPGPGASSGLKSGTTFTIQVKVANLAAGQFSDATTQYYSQPQSLQNGVVSGHTHVTVQDMGPNFNPQQPLDAKTFVFFKGINDPGDGNGNLAATVTGGLPAGNYRVCTIGTAFTHQPALMPVARRGAQEDCQKFSVA